MANENRRFRDIEVVDEPHYRGAKIYDEHNHSDPNHSQPGGVLEALRGIPSRRRASRKPH